MAVISIMNISTRRIPSWVSSMISTEVTHVHTSFHDTVPTDTYGVFGGLSVIKEPDAPIVMVVECIGNIRIVHILKHLENGDFRHLIASASKPYPAVTSQLYSIAKRGADQSYYIWQAERCVTDSMNDTRFIHEAEYINCFDDILTRARNSRLVKLSACWDSDAVGIKSSKLTFDILNNPDLADHIAASAYANLGFKMIFGHFYPNAIVRRTPLLIDLADRYGVIKRKHLSAFIGAPLPVGSLEKMPRTESIIVGASPEASEKPVCSLPGTMVTDLLSIGLLDGNVKIDLCYEPKQKYLYITNMEVTILTNDGMFVNSRCVFNSENDKFISRIKTHLASEVSNYITSEMRILPSDVEKLTVARRGFDLDISAVTKRNGVKSFKYDLINLIDLEDYGLPNLSHFSND